MKCIVGIDLGSTTTKAVCIDENERILGRGITNSRSNYALACEIAREEAAINSRFHLLRRRIEEQTESSRLVAELMEWLECKFKLAQHLRQVAALERRCTEIVDEWPDQEAKQLYLEALPDIFERMRRETLSLFRPNVGSRSDFFRDIASSQYMEIADAKTGGGTLSFERLTGVFDKAILLVEGESFAHDYREYLDYASSETIREEKFRRNSEAIQRATEYAAGTEFEILNTIGTGYGRQTLPFPKRQIRSEILCHGLGAHKMFPQTRTVLDIGGQDTKAIQIDKDGIVTNFQMNDRCAAGCGRYLGYIADEMNMGVHELGPLALNAERTVRINSTCTVFAGAELRERLALGEKREDILSGLHRAIILRALSLLARSGGVRNEFTFTGGVAKNPAATGALRRLITENYGEITMNVSVDSIFTGALGAALFAMRDATESLVDVDLTKLRKKAG